MKNIHRIWNGILLAAILFSCEDKISPTLERATPVLVVDAWLNNKPGFQTITLTQTQTYFDNTIPPAVSGAVVTVKDDKGTTFAFPEDDKKTGDYIWKPLANEVFGTIGNRYTLMIKVNGETFESTSYMGRVPVIDSITFDTEKRIGSKDSLTRAEFWSTDPVMHTGYDLIKMECYLISPAKLMWPTMLVFQPEGKLMALHLLHRSEEV